VSVEGAELRRAAALGTVTGARTFLAPAALALRGRLGKAAKFALPVLAAGELVGDKLPSAPPRSEGPGLVGRVVSGALAGRVSGGSRGLRVGAAFALASTYPSQVLRAQIVKRTPVPDIACAVPEDLIGASLAALASSEPRPDPSASSAPKSPDFADTPGVDGPKTPAMVEFSAHQHGRCHGIVTAAALGLAAAAVGTAAMTSAQNWVVKLTGGEESIDPVDLAKKTALGLPFGLLAARGGRASRPVDGLALGLAACALDVADRRNFVPADLVPQLIYGACSSAALEAFTA
jgi:uncharacterized membrane protein